MYRAVALLALRAGLTAPLAEGAADTVTRLIAEHDIDVAAGVEGTVVLVDGVDVGGELRTAECSMMASAVSALPEVRRRLVAEQRRIGRLHGGVMEGRDIGSVVFPDAALRVYLTASNDTRAHRRYRDLACDDPALRLEEVRRDLSKRDLQDASRGDSPLLVAPGAVVIDSTRMTPEEVVERLVHELELSRERMLDSSDRNTVRSRNDAI